MGRPLHRLPGRRPSRQTTGERAPPLVDHRRRSGQRPYPRAASRSGRRSSRSGRRRTRRGSKAESLQPIGAFKIRGAYHAIAGLDEATRARGVITYSSGNHAQGVARAARLLGCPAVVVMPSDAPAIKRARVEADGAEVVIVGTASRRAPAGRRAARGGARAGDHPALRRRPDHRRPGHGRPGDRRGRAGPRAVLVPIGGGGLASGVAVAIKALRPTRAGHRRRAGARRRRARVAGRAARSSAGRRSASARTIADGDADAVDRRAAVRPPARAARRRRDGVRGGDRRRRPAGRRASRASSSSRPARSSVAALAFRAAEIGHDPARRPGGRRSSAAATSTRALPRLPGGAAPRTERPRAPRPGARRGAASRRRISGQLDRAPVGPAAASPAPRGASRPRRGP